MGTERILKAWGEQKGVKVMDLAERRLFICASRGHHFEVEELMRFVLFFHI